MEKSRLSSWVDAKVRREQEHDIWAEENRDNEKTREFDSHSKRASFLIFTGSYFFCPVYGVVDHFSVCPNYQLHRTGFTIKVFFARNRLLLLNGAQLAVFTTKHARKAYFFMICNYGKEVDMMYHSMYQCMEFHELSK